MINKDEAKIMAILAIAKLFGKEYVRSHINKACETYPDGERMKNPPSPISFAQ